MLDPFLEEMISPLITPLRKVVHDVTFGDLKGQSMNEHGDLIFYVINFICKTRGYKTIGMSIELSTFSYFWLCYPQYF